ncbi:aminotransferase class V-fold PLP-dependent enzyme [Ornithinibacillus sp. 4-3]|uniref:cysteine desulfurase n=1 Tax=Ornithinibacillus sp. 4-3 TaxID=3231488 RepID=A0AB39HSQ0_9BACI
MIYFDQAASSFPKPKEVVDQMIDVVTHLGANPGRGGHQLARKADMIINETRNKAAALFGCTNPKQCLFYPNATIALNQAIKGLNWQKGDHVIATSMEHNSLRRPLEYIRNNFGVDVSYIDWQENDEQFIQSFQQEIKENTKLIAITHASNVTGSLIPIDAILEIAHLKGILTLVDASQTAGHLPINMKKQGIDMLVFPGHKALLGPQGTGMLLVEGEVLLSPIHHGGTGNYSESIEQPEAWPEKYESGTLNTPGIAGLLAALKHYEKNKTEIVPRETILIQKLYNGLKQIHDVQVYWTDKQPKQIPIVAFNVKDISSQELSMILDSHYQIAVRGGLHCSPLAHQTLNTLEQGVVRASINMYNTEGEIEIFLQAIQQIIDAYENI